MSYDEHLANRIRVLLMNTPGLEEKKMFGGVGFLVNGNMACGVHCERLIVRLPEADYASALEKPNVFVFDMTGRPMKGWIMISQSGLTSDDELIEWVERGVRHAQSLPRK